MPLVTVDNMCRTANGWDINGFGQLKDGRGNICPVTIIMPTLAMEAKEKIIDDLGVNYAEEFLVEDFMNLLNKKIHATKYSNHPHPQVKKLRLTPQLVSHSSFSFPLQ